MLGAFTSCAFRGASLILFKVIKYSPEIGMGIGLLSSVGAMGTAISATLDVKENVLDKADEQMKSIEETKASHPEAYPEECYKKDIAEVRKNTAVGICKAYWKPALLFSISTFCYFRSFRTIKGRYLGTLAVCKILQDSCDRLEEENRRLKAANGIETEYTIKDAEGQDISPEEQKAVVKVPKAPSQYARFFDESCREWCNTPEFNLIFLKYKQAYFNNLLIARGYVFLNEVYDELGMPRSQAGQVVGWLRNGKNSDGFIDFGIFDRNDEANRAFVNGTENVILLDFNVDGVIYDKI